MPNNISGFGLQVNIVAIPTFPIGFQVSQFADDADPFDLPSLQIGDKAMGLNGDKLRWAKANPITVTLNVIPGSDDDVNLSILFQANRPGRSKIVTNDDITMIGVYSDGTTITLTGGSIDEGMPGKSISSAGRMKSKAYIFSFENQVLT